MGEEKKKKKKSSKRNKKVKKKKQKKKQHAKHKHVKKYDIVLADEGSGEDRDESNSYDDNEFSSDEHRYSNDNDDGYESSNKRTDIPHTSEMINIEHEQAEGASSEMFNNSPL